MSVHGLESVPRYRELLDRLLGEDLDFIPQGFILEQDDEELAYLKRELRWSTQPQVVAAVAAQNGFWQIRHFANSVKVVTVTKVFVSCAAARTFNYAITTTVRGASGGFAAIATDTRWVDPIVPAGNVIYRDASLDSTSGSVAAGFGTDQQIAQGSVAVAGVMTDMQFPVVTLAPGTGVVVSDPTVNEAFTVYAIGRSRPARPEELRL